MNKAQANQALEMGHAIRHNSSLPDGYYYIKEVTNTITIDGKEKEIVEKQVFDENQECMGNPDIFFRMKGLQMHETGWSVSIEYFLNRNILPTKRKNGKAA